jgi:hypothetical protein
MIKQQLIFGFYGSNLVNDKFHTGTLLCTSKFGNMKFMATTGLKFYQGIGSCNKKGKGGIPPCELVNIQKYTVTTKPIPMPHTKGVEGNFYQILPFEVLVEQYGKKTARGDFGIHKDASVQGTSGCIGIPPGEHWEEFEKLMKKIQSDGTEKLDLFVSAEY